MLLPMEPGEARKLDEFVSTTAFIMRLFIFMLVGAQVDFGPMGQYLWGQAPTTEWLGRKLGLMALSVFRRGRFGKILKGEKPFPARNFALGLSISTVALVAGNSGNAIGAADFFPRIGHA
ncbi:MAG: hypothetical protein E6G85_31100 [Alphaproteobacteria bacterium]|nr:MAG: hypothetical protein E6G85_31100 [Alphaproteobacteria bacterium]